ncbi:hypothetical protein C8R47DRAFT_257476 [Mycena vitilis]|nr:hypothetical protein C8R47DRAFT_257476 [Mycena vitilis]
MERLAATQMLPQSRLIAPNPLVTLGLQIHEEERVLLCVACEQAVRPSAALHHAKKEHGLTLASPADREVFDTLGEKYNLYRQPSEVPRRTFGLAPVEGIKVIEDGWICRHCSFAAPMQGTLQKHWRQADHRARAPGWLAFNDGAIRGSIQTFFNPESQAWFEVVPELAHAAPGDFFEAYLRRYGDSFDEASQSLPGPVTFKENPPINRLTFWDVHLAPWLRDKRSVFHLRSLMTLTRAENRAQDGPDRLCRIVPAYLVAIRTLSEDASLPVRSMLMTYPRVENHGEVWRGLASNATLLKYGTLLQRFAFAILATRSRACPTNYRLPLTAFEEKRVDEYQHSLRQPPPIDPEALVRFREREIAEFHAFIALFLLKRGGENKSSGKGRFDIPIECLCAIEAVHEDGRLKSPVETTPVFARLEYLIRGTILYEADTAATVHGVPLDIAFESLAMENLHVSALSPYNVIVDLQRAVSRLAFLTVRPPSMRVSEDMDTFYHADKVLNFPEYRAGIRSGLEALKQRLEALLFGLDIPYRTPDKVADDWNCEDRGYGFLSNNDFLQSNRPYLRGLLASSAVTIGKRNAAGGFILNAAGVVTVLQRDTAFLECLMPLLFIGSSSSRGAEFVEHKITNGTMPRTLFMNGPDLWLVTRRWKQKVHQVFVPVLVPPELAAIVIRYLAIIRPGIVELVRAMRGDNASILHSEYLWASAGALMDENRLSSLLETFTRTHCGVALTLRPHRHLQLEIFRTRLGSEAQIEDDEEDDVYAMCRSHSLETSRKVYAPETNHLPSLSSDLIHRYEHACLLWHQVLGLRPDFPLILSIAERRRQREAAENLAPGSPSLPQQDSRAFLNHVTAVVTEQVQKLGSSLQASVRKNVVEAVAEVLHRMDPAAGRGSSSQVTEEDSAALAAVHAFFGSSPWQPPVEDQPQHTSHPSETIPLARSSSRESDTLAMVGQLLKVDAPTWKLPEQKEVVQLTVECEQNFVAVLPPGGGKSLGYQVAASKEQKEGLWTVVMCPNRSLLNDQLRSATKLGLKTHLWAVSEPACNVPDGFNLLFVALESIVTRKFKASVFHSFRPLYSPLMHRVGSSARMRSAWYALSMTRCTSCSRKGTTVTNFCSSSILRNCLVSTFF